MQYSYTCGLNFIITDNYWAGSLIPKIIVILFTQKKYTLSSSSSLSKNRNGAKFL